MIRFFLLLGFGLLTSPFVYSEDGSSIDSEVLRNMLLRPVPQYRGAINFFSTIPNEAMTLAIRTDGGLSALVQKGEGFKGFYLKKLENVFGKDGTDFFLNPEIAAVKFVHSLQPIFLDKTNALYTEQQAANTALRSTLERFALDSDLSIGRLVDLAQNDNTARAALEFYKRKYYQLLSYDTPEIKPKHRSPHEVKLKIEEYILSLRTKNFLDAILRRSSKKIKIKSNATAAKDNWEELLFASIPQKSVSWGPRTQQGVSHVVQLQNWTRLFVKPYSYLALKQKKKDYALASDFYEVHSRRPSMYRYNIGLGDKIKISESDFIGIMEISAPHFEDLSRDNLKEIRFDIEAARRDVFLAEFLNFLFEVDDATIPALEDRLKDRDARSKIEADNFYSHSLTEEIRSLDLRLRQDTLPEMIRWAGYSVHPDYWRLREKIALELDKPSFSTESISTRTHSLKQKPGESHATKMDSYRKRSPDARISRIIAKVAFLSMLLLSPVSQEARDFGKEALILGASVTAEATSGLAKNLDLPWLAEFAQLLASMGLNLPEFGGIDPNDSLENSYNIGWDSHERSKRIPIFLLTNYKLPNSEEMPTNFRLLNSRNLVITHSQKSKVFAPVKMKDISQVLFELTTIVPVKAIGDILPIYTPEGFQPIGIKISKRSSKGPDIALDASKDFDVFVSKRTGLYFAMLNTYAGEPKFTYTVYYGKVDDAFKPREALAFSNLDSSELLKLNGALEESGGTQLAQKLNFIQGQGNITIDQIANGFSSTGLYTYSSPKLSNPFLIFNGNPFQSYARFLNNGVYYYQCTGANQLLVKYLGEYFSKRLPWVVVEPVSGFVVPRGSSFAMQSNGHMETLVTIPSQPFTYKILDATPHNIDPKYINYGSKHPGEFDFEEALRKNKKPFDGYTHPNKAVISRREDLILEEVSQDDETKDKGAKQSSWDTAIKSLENAKFELFKEVTARSKMYLALQQMEKVSSLPGLKLLAISNVILEVAKQQRDAISGLILVLALQRNIPLSTAMNEPYHSELRNLALLLIADHKEFGKALQVLVDEEVAKWERRKNDINQQAVVKPNNPWRYLLDPTLDQLIAHLGKVIKSHDWTPLCRGALERLI